MFNFTFGVEVLGFPTSFDILGVVSGRPRISVFGVKDFEATLCFGCRIFTKTFGFDFHAPKKRFIFSFRICTGFVLFSFGVLIRSFSFSFRVLDGPLTFSENAFSRIFICCFGVCSFGFVCSKFDCWTITTVATAKTEKNNTTYFAVQRAI